MCVNVWNITSSLEAVYGSYRKLLCYFWLHRSAVHAHSPFLYGVIYKIQKLLKLTLHGVCMKEDSEYMHAYSRMCVQVHGTYRSVLGRLGAWLPDRSGCTSPGRSRPVRDTGQIWACLYKGENQPQRAQVNERQIKQTWVHLVLQILSYYSVTTTSDECFNLDSKFDGIISFCRIPRRKINHVLGKIQTSLRSTTQTWKHVTILRILKNWTTHSRQPDEQSLHM